MKHGVNIEYLSDNTQFYMPINSVGVAEKLSVVMYDIKDMEQLTLNPNITKCLVVGKKTNFRRLS